RVSLHVRCSSWLPVLIQADCFILKSPGATKIYTLSLHDALPISETGSPASACQLQMSGMVLSALTWLKYAVHQLFASGNSWWTRSEEHTSELQSRSDLVCRLLLEKKKAKDN